MLAGEPLKVSPISPVVTHSGGIAMQKWDEGKVRFVVDASEASWSDAL
jgi:hypothetical protein